MKGNENVPIAGVEDSDVGEMGFDLASELEADLEGNVFFLGNCAEAAGIVAAVAGIDNDRTNPVICFAACANCTIFAPLLKGGSGPSIG